MTLNRILKHFDNKANWNYKPETERRFGMELTPKEKKTKTAGKVFAWVVLIICASAAAISYYVAYKGIWPGPGHHTLLFAITFSGAILSVNSFILLHIIKELEKKVKEQQETAEPQK